MVHHVESFYGVYLLYNINPKFKGRTYIGFTVDPSRRVKQHNTGKHAGGAWRTSGKGPWEMVVITHGFPNEISALRFEWAWQNPEKSRRLRHLTKKTRKETAYDYRFRILSEMLRSAPWNRLSLTVRWLIQSYQRDFSPDLMPPLHMDVAYGPVKAVRVKGAPTNRGKRKHVTDNTEQPGKRKHVTDTTEQPEASQVSEDTQTDEQLDNTKLCYLCEETCKELELVRCYHDNCNMICHMVCLANQMLDGDKDGHVIPISGECPCCERELLWGDVIRHKQGCFLNVQDKESGDSEHWASDLQTQ